LERRAKDKHSSLLRKSVNYDRKKFYSTGPRMYQMINLVGLMPYLQTLELRISMDKGSSLFVLRVGDKGEKVL
jgi:hypothetical protein